MSSGLEIEHSIHEFLGSSRLGSKTMVPLKLAELNISFKDINQNVQNVDFTLGENDLEELINELEDALAIADKVETK